MNNTKTFKKFIKNKDVFQNITFNINNTKTLKINKNA